MTIILILFFITYLILSWRRLDWAVMFLLAALPAYLIRFSVFGFPTTLLEAMILVAFAVWVIKTRTCLVCNVINNLKGRRTTERYPFDIEIVLLLVIAFVSAGVAGFSNSSLGILKAYFFEPVLVFLLVMNVFKNPQIYKFDTNLQITNNNENSANGIRMPRIDFGEILWPLTVSALGVALIAFFQKLTGLFAVEAFWPRVTGPFPYPNALGLYLGPLVLIMVGWFIHLLSFRTRAVARVRNPLNVARIKGFLPFGAAQGRNDTKVIIIAVIIILSILAIYFARSEGAAIGIIAALFVFGILAGGKLRWATLGITLIAGIGLVSYAPLRTYAIEKITLRDLSGEIRKQQWRETWAMMTESPERFIFGTGLSGYRAAIKPYHQAGIFFNKDREPWEQFHRQTVFNEEYRRTHWQPVEIYMYPHNIFLNFWTELGLAGALLFIWIFIKSIKYLVLSIKQEKYLTIGVLGALVVTVVHGLVDVPYFKNDLAVMFWVLMFVSYFIYIKYDNKLNYENSKINL